MLFNLNAKFKLLVVFDDSIVDMRSNKKLEQVVNGLLIRGRKLNTSVVYTTLPYFVVLKFVTLNSTRYFIMEVSNKCELLQIAINHSWVSDFKYFMNLYKICTDDPHSFLVNRTTFSLDYPLRFRCNFLKNQ